MGGKKELDLFVRKGAFSWSPGRQGKILHLNEVVSVNDGEHHDMPAERLMVPGIAIHSSLSRAQIQALRKHSTSMNTSRFLVHMIRIYRLTC